MKAQRQTWSAQQKALRAALDSGEDHQRALDLFMAQHAAVHDHAVSEPEAWSLAEIAWADLDEATARRIPHNEEHSPVWAFWHCARIEDVTMHMLIADEPQLWHTASWAAKLGIDLHHTGNAMTTAEIADLSTAIDLDALRAYRADVGRRTREIVGALEPGAFQIKVDPARLQRIMDEGAVLPAAYGVVEYWSRRTIAGLLLMPPTRHNVVHLNEVLRLRERNI